MALKAATAAHHDVVDRIFSRADLTDRAGYATFLAAQADAHIAVEDALDRAGAASIVPDWDIRRRGPAIRADLAALGREAPKPETSIRFEGVAGIFGAAYVLEGSRLGGAMLARSVPADFPRDFLSPAEPPSWRNFIAALDRAMVTARDIEQATEAARHAFSLYENSGRRHLGVN